MYINEKLRAKDTYNHQTEEEILIIETNVSWVYLTGEYAYKRKKAVKFGDVLDFSTLEKRKIACENEITLNKRLAPEMYLEVVKLTKEGKIEGSGEIIEYLVKMKQYNQQQLLTEIIKKDLKLSSQTIKQLAELIGEFHKKNIYKEKLNVHENIYEKCDENFRTLATFEGFNLDQLYVNRVLLFLEKNKSFWEQRIDDERIVDGHGDLQLKNIYLVENSLILFDCIEFNINLRIQDVLEEVAFFAMDLEFHNLPKEANEFLQLYLKLIDEKIPFDSPFINFYKSYRAMVRTKVHYSTYLFGSEENAQKEAEKELALKYYNLAKTYKF